MNGDTYSRRSVLRAGAGAVAAGATIGVSMPAHAQASFDGFLADTGNYDELADRTGSDEVTIEVGVEANGGNWGYGPAAVRVDPGTTVTWEWVAGSHDVAAEDGSFGSELTDESGHTFTHTFESEGVTKYACTPHRSMGMRGVVVVGEPSLSGSGSGGGGSESDGSGSGDSGSTGGSGDEGGADGALTGGDWATVGFALSLVAGLLSPFGFVALRDDDSRR